MLIEFINSNENWQELLSNFPYNIKIKQDGEYFLLKYDQLNSPKDDPIVKECRGPIVWFDSESNEWIYVCRPFTRFFNYGEECAAKIDWKSARVLEKVDGSLIKLWYHNGWHVSTSGMIDAVNCNYGEVNFFELFLQAAGDTKESWDKFFANKIYDEDDDFWGLNPQTTYLFELVSPLNKLVVPYDETALYYLGEINNMTGQETYCYTNCRFKAKEVAQIPYINNIKDAVAAANKISADDGEGFVVVDKYFNRIKIKGEDYLKHFYYRNNGVITKTRVINAIKEEWFDDLWAYDKEARPFMWKICDNLHRMGNILTARACQNKDKIRELSDKEFAFYIKDKYDDSDILSYLFYVKKTADPLDGFDWMIKNCTTSRIVRMLGEFE